MGEIVLRRRWEPTLHVDVYEVKLGDEFLMSSLFTVSEIALATLGLAACPDTDAGSGIDVVVGGLGLGYTAGAVLEDTRVASLTVIEALPEVVGWHEDHLLPFALGLTRDPRCRLVQGDFFAMVAGDTGLGADAADRWHAILVDIDHTPRHHLHAEPRAVLRAGRAPAARPLPASGWCLRLVVGRPTRRRLHGRHGQRLRHVRRARRHVPEPVYGW